MVKHQTVTLSFLIIMDVVFSWRCFPLQWISNWCCIFLRSPYHCCFFRTNLPVVMGTKPDCEARRSELWFWDKSDRVKGWMKGCVTEGECPYDILVILDVAKKGCGRIQLRILGECSYDIWEATVNNGARLQLTLCLT